MTLLRPFSIYARWALVGGFLIPFGVHAQRSDLLPAKTREVVVDRAEALVGRDRAALAKLPNDPVNPFTGAVKAEPAEVAVGAPVVVVRSVVSDEQQLRSLAPSILPSGTISLGGEGYLLFGQKKLKVGETLPIVFEGATYEVVITDIQSTSFSIRLGAAELVRPIKPVTRP